jgi:RNA polymerase sigma factor (sigma-70 family)
MLMAPHALRFALPAPPDYSSAPDRRRGRDQMTESGLDAVFMSQRAALLRFLHARGAGSDAEDLLQELWLKIAAGTPGPVAEPIPYLFRMADNLMLDRRRSQQRRARREENWTEMVGDTVTGASDQPSPERLLIGRERLRAIEKVLADLGERTSHVFRRYRIDGVGQRDIAVEFGISLSAVEKHLQKAYRALLDVQRREADADREMARRHSIEGVGDVAG